MNIYNFKLNKSLLLKFILVICFIIACIFLYMAYTKIFNNSYQVVNDECKSIGLITKYNYSSILKTVHENVDDYIGKEFEYTGYVYRVSDLSSNQFILARDMIISSDFKTVVVGFLCECDNASNYQDNTWISIKGIIQKGYYYGDIPIIKIKDISTIDKPEDCFVYPPVE